MPASMLHTRSLDLLLLSVAGALSLQACGLPPPDTKPEADAGGGGTCNADADGYPVHDRDALGTSPGIDGGTIAAVACNAANSIAALALFDYSDGYQLDKSIPGEVQRTISAMSIADLATQMRGTKYLSVTSPQYTDIQRSYDTAGIRGYRFRDANRGLNLGEDMRGSKPNAGVVNGAHVGFSTAFPVAMARGAAFDLDLEYAIGEAIADELQAAGESVLCAPCMNILRHPLWGRAQETYGEDSFHLGRLASAMTIGIQKHIAANPKHFMAYNIEDGRQKQNAVMDEQTLREIYGRHFRMVIQDAGAASIMASYNQVNGKKSTQNYHTLTEILRNDFGFQGFVLSDWFAMPNESSADATRLRSTAIEGIRAGLDIEVPWALNYGQLESIVNSGTDLTRADLERSATRILTQKYRFNCVAPGSKCGLGTPITTFSHGAIGGCDVVHINLARRAALEGMVLLKNDTSMLPINPSVRKVAVLGAVVDYVASDGGGSSGGTIHFAVDPVTGDKGSSRVFHDPKKGVGPWAGIDKWKPNAEISVVQGSSLAEVGGGQDVDFFVVVAGLTPQDEGEEYTRAGDRKSFALDAKQDPAKQTVQTDLIKAVAALGKPMVVVLEAGSVVDMSAWLGEVPAVVLAWYPGMVGGEALGQLVWGQANFSGKLPITWGYPNQYGDLTGQGVDTYADYYLGYRMFEHNNQVPVYRFGHGLSYTTFEYTDVQLGCTSMTEGAVLPVAVRVKNTGGVAGEETVMVFVSFPGTQARRGPKELKGFARISLQPNQDGQVTIPIRLSDLDYFKTDSSNPTQGKWVVETGNVDVWVGGSYATLKKVGTVPVTGYEVKPKGGADK
jgi:beta-glucosidase